MTISEAAAWLLLEAVVDPAGRYDASNGGDIDGLHWSLGFETVQLGQLKSRYYKPHLLSKLAGFNAEPVSEVSGFDKLALYPLVQVNRQSDQAVNVHLENQGGGIGPVQVFLNGKMVVGDARQSDTVSDAAKADISLQLAEVSKYLKPSAICDLHSRSVFQPSVAFSGSVALRLPLSLAY